MRGVHGRFPVPQGQELPGECVRREGRSASTTINARAVRSARPARASRVHRTASAAPAARARPARARRRRSAPRTRTAPTTRTASNGFCIKTGQANNVGTTCALQTVYFAFDDSSIQQSERDRLDANNSCIGQNKGKSVFLDRPHRYVGHRGVQHRAVRAPRAVGRRLSRAPRRRSGADAGRAEGRDRADRHGRRQGSSRGVPMALKL